MKHIFTGFSLIGAFALLALAVGCAGTQTQSKENLLIAAGFKTVVPKTAAQQQKLQALPPGKVAMIQKGGKPTTCFRRPLTTGPWLAVQNSTRLTSSSAWRITVSYTHLRAHETPEHRSPLVARRLLTSTQG